MYLHLSTIAVSMTKPHEDTQNRKMHLMFTFIGDDRLEMTLSFLDSDQSQSLGGHGVSWSIED